jgi:hypothetical protein
MAGKYVRLKRDFEHYKQHMSELVDRLTSVIENTLPPESETKSGEVEIKTEQESETGLVRNE